MTLTRKHLALIAAALGALALVAWSIAKVPAPAQRGAAKGLSELSDLVVAPAQAASERAPAGAAEPALDISALARRAAEALPAADAFAARSWVRPPPPAPPPPPPVMAPPAPPQAPPLPFKYLGRLDESAARTVFYLGIGERLIVVAVGETIDGTWRIDGFEAGQLRLTYLPLDLRQQLAIGAAP